MKKNSGYTLIEMIIVIAIIAVMSGLATITFGIVKKARCNAAVNTFNNQLTSLWVRTKAISQGKTQSSPRSSDDSSKYRLCMIIEKNTDSGDDIRDNSYVMYYGYAVASVDASTGAESAANSYVKRKDSDGNDEIAAVLPDILKIEYKKTGATSPEPDDRYIIQFNKSDGSVITGAGTYTFIFNDIEYGTVVVNGTTGNHYTTSTR